MLRIGLGKETKSILLFRIHIQNDFRVIQRERNQLKNAQRLFVLFMAQITNLAV